MNHVRGRKCAFYLAIMSAKEEEWPREDVRAGDDGPRPSLRGHVCAGNRFRARIFGATTVYTTYKRHQYQQPDLVQKGNAWSVRCHLDCCYTECVHV